MKRFLRTLALGAGFLAVMTPRPAGAAAPAATEATTQVPALRFSIERYLNIRAASSGDISPDDRSVLFRTNITGTQQAWRIPATGGWPEQLTAFEDNVSAAIYAPEDGRIAFLKAVGGSEQDQIFLLSADGADITPLVNEEGVTHYWGAWSHDGTRISYTGNARDPKYFDPYVIDVKTGKSTRVHEEAANYYARGFSPKDRYLLLDRSDSNFNNNLYAYELATGQLIDLTPHPGQDARFESAVWTPDEKSLYVVTDKGRDFMNLARIDMADRSLTFLEERKWDTEGVRLSEDGQLCAVLTNVDGASELKLFRGAPFGPPVAGPPLADGLIGNVTFSRDNSFIVFSYASTTKPSDIYRWDISAGRLTQLTRSSTNGIPADSFVSAKRVSYTSFDGLKVPGYLYLPPGATPGHPLPCLVTMHGGPEAQERAIFNAANQYYLQAGYAIFAPNVRGSTGYGKAYSHLDDVRKRQDSVKDMAAAVDYLKKTGQIDPRRIAVMGGSYGGFMTLAGLTSYPELFAAGVDVVGIANYITFLEKTSSYRRANRAAEYGDPDKDRDFLVQVSPINKADKIVAPLMILQGANDPRVPQNEADQMAAAIRARGGVVEYLLYPDEGHGITKLKNRIDAYPKIVAFLDRYVKNRMTAGPRG